MNPTASRTFLSVVLVIGALGAVGPTGSYGYFTDERSGAGFINASDDFGSGLVADAGGPYDVFEGNTIELDGTGSQGNIQTYRWSKLGDDGSLSNTNDARASYTAPPDVDSDTVVTVELEVEDTNGNTRTDTADVTVMDADNDCGNSEIVFCSIAVTDTGANGYDVTYDVDDPEGGSTFKSVNVTLLEVKNSKNQVRVRSDSTSTADTINVRENNMAGTTYIVRVEMYDKANTRIECREVTDDSNGEGSWEPSDCSQQ